MDINMIKERLSSSMDKFLITVWGENLFTSSFINKMADYIVNECEDIFNTSDSWIRVCERLPDREEYLTVREDGSSYLSRLNIAFMTDTIEYAIGYYDGYKWFDDRTHIIKDVIAWRPFVKLNESEVI